MRTNIVLDDELVQQAFTLTGIRTKRELMHLALSELVWRRRKKDLLDLAGKVKLRPDFDHKAMRSCSASMETVSADVRASILAGTLSGGIGSGDSFGTNVNPGTTP